MNVYISVYALIHSINIPLSICCVPGIILDVRSRKMNKMRSLLMKSHVWRYKHTDVNLYTHVYTQISLQPNLSPQFPLLTVWVIPKAKNDHVLHGIIVLFCACLCVHMHLRSSNGLLDAWGKLHRFFTFEVSKTVLFQVWTVGQQH